MLWTRITQLQKQRNELGDIHFDWRYVADYLVPFAAFANSGLNSTLRSVAVSDNFGAQEGRSTVIENNTWVPSTSDNFGQSDFFSRKISTLLRVFANNLGMNDSAAAGFST